MEFLVTGLISIFTAVGLTGTIAGVSTAAIAAWTVVIAASLAVSYVLARQQIKPKSSQQQQTVRQPVPDRRITIGRDKVGGAFSFYAAANNVLYQSHVFGEGPWDGIESIWLNQTQAGADLTGGSGVSPWYSYVTVETRLGTLTQAASAKLRAAFPTWTEAHQGKGLVYAVLCCGAPSGKDAAQKFSQIFPGGPPQLRVLGRGVALYDPRDGVSRWSENPALAIRYYLTNERCMNIPASYIDEGAFAAFAGVCDELVPVDSGGVEPRYTVSHTFSLTQDHRTTLSELLRACDAELYPTPEGKVAVRGGRWEEPAIEITADDLVTPFYEYSQGNGRSAAFNRLKTTFKDPLNDYQPVEIAPWQDPESQVMVGVLTQDFRLESVTSFRQARALAKIFGRKSNPRHRLTVTVRYACAIQLWGARTVRVTIPELGLHGETFAVLAASLNLGAMTGKYTLASLSLADYVFTTSEEGVRPPVSTETSPGSPPEPTGLALALDRVAITAGVYQVRIRASVNALAGAGSTAWGTSFRYRKVSAPEWADMAYDGQWSGLSEPLEDGATYEVQAAHSGLSGPASLTRSAYTDSLTITATADIVPPGLPQAAMASKLGGAIIIDWQAPNSENFAATRIYRGTSGTYADAALIATIYSAPGSVRSHADSGLADGSYWYWLASINRSGSASAVVATDPASITLP